MRQPISVRTASESLPARKDGTLRKLPRHESHSRPRHIERTPVHPDPQAYFVGPFTTPRPLKFSNEERVYHREYIQVPVYVESGADLEFIARTLCEAWGMAEEADRSCDILGRGCY